MAFSIAPGSASAQDVPVDLPHALGCDFTDPSVCLYPWPNDLFTKADPSTPTGRRMDLQPWAMPRNVAGKPIDNSDFNRADGFSPGQMIVTKVPGLDTLEAFQNTGAVPVDDLARALDEDQAIVVIDAATGERQLIWSEIDSNSGCKPSEEPKTGPCNPADSALQIRPAKNWLEGHRYIVALRNLKDSAGNTIEPGALFKAFRDKEMLSTVPPFSQRAVQMESIFATLADAGIERENLYQAWDFTVASEESLAGRMLHIRDDAFAQLGDTNLADMEVQGTAPAYTISSATDHPDGDIARTVEGTFTVPCYLDKPKCPPVNSKFLLDPQTGKPIQLPGNTYEANFTCRIPRWALNADGSLRSTTRPSLYGHGLMGSAGEVESGAQTRLANEHGFTMCATDWIGMATTDLPNVATAIVDLSNFPTLADRVQQGILNFLYLGRLLVHPDGLNSDNAFKFGGQGVLNTEQLYYDGNSQGGIIGGALAAVYVDGDRAVLGVPAMNYSTLLARSVDFVGSQDPAEITENQDPIGFSGYSTPMYAAYPNELERPLIFSMIQMLWDRAEANGYAQHMTTDPYANTPAHKILMHVAFGDHQVANVAAEVEARTIGASMLRNPSLDPNSYWGDEFFGIDTFASLPSDGSAYVVWQSGTPAAPKANIPPRPQWGYGGDPHSHPRSSRRARVQKSAFLRPDGTVIDVCNGGPCYADDR